MGREARCEATWGARGVPAIAPLGETAVRGLLRRRGLVDVKVASVSPRLTALAFVRRA